MAGGAARQCDGGSGEVADRFVAHCLSALAAVTVVAALVDRDARGRGWRGRRCGDKDLRRADLAAVWIDDGHRLARVVHKHSLPGAVRLAHRGLEALDPAAVEFAELAVAQTARALFAILDPQQPQRHSLLALQFGVHPGPVRRRALSRAGQRRRRKEPPEQRAFIRVVWQRPTQPGGLGALQVFTDGALGDAAATGDILRIGWSAWTGIRARHGPDYALYCSETHIVTQIGDVTKKAAMFAQSLVRAVLVNWQKALLALALLALSLGAPVRAAQARPADLTLTVNSTLDAVDADPGNGVCATSGGACTLRAAIQEANVWPGADAILLPAGVYRLTLVGPDEDQSATGDLDIRDDLTLTGAGAGVTIVDGIGQDRVFHVLTGAGSPPIMVTISGVTIRNGVVAAPGGGGGLCNEDEGRVTLSHATVISNVATFGGGVYAQRWMTITASLIRDNQGVYGGGIYNKFTTLKLIDSTVSGNHALYGGGLNNFYFGTALIVSGSTLTGNTATQDGGAINLEAGTLELVNSTVSGNTASAGGGLNNQYAASALIANSTIVSNSASSGAAGIVAWSSVVLRNSLIAHNLGGNCSGAIVSQGYNLDSGASCQFTATGDLSNTLPLLGPLQDNGGATFTHALLAGSPAIDAGNPALPGSGGTACEAVDQRGLLRPGGAACDIGAFEFNAPTGVELTSLHAASEPPWAAAPLAPWLVLTALALVVLLAARWRATAN
jgi:CSLREA domain-containing protein